jgi:hypothetical protein
MRPGKARTCGPTYFCRIRSELLPNQSARTPTNVATIAHLTQLIQLNPRPEIREKSAMKNPKIIPIVSPPHTEPRFFQYINKETRATKPKTSQILGFLIMPRLSTSIMNMSNSMLLQFQTRLHMIIKSRRKGRCLRCQSTWSTAWCPFSLE